MMRLHIGCGPNVLEGWVNIDSVARAPGVRTDVDVLAMPFTDASVDHILAEHVFEHFAFAEEERLWRECARVLRPGGLLEIEVPDFEWVCQAFLAGEDRFRAFYQTGALDHYFGSGRDTGQRWGIVQTMFFGNQNGAGQFHKSAYTKGKIRDVAALAGFAQVRQHTLHNKGGQAIRALITR